jgi:hypothetical protein
MSGLADKSASRADRRSGAGTENRSLHPAWRKLMTLCEQMGYGEIERLKIHDGLPVLAEITRQKVRFIPP